MEPAYRERYRDLHAKHWWWRARETAVQRLIVRDIAPRLSARARILEIGSGPGLNFHLLTPLGRTSGVEIDEGWKSDPELAHYDVRFGNFVELDFGNERFDLVLALDVMEHIEPNSILLEPGKSGEIAWRFGKPGEYEIACNIPGHYESGMVAKVTVLPR